VSWLVPSSLKPSLHVHERTGSMQDFFKKRAVSRSVQPVTRLIMSAEEGPRAEALTSDTMWERVTRFVPDLDHDRRVSVSVGMAHKSLCP